MNPVIVPPALELYIDGLRSHDLEKIGASFADEIVFVTPARTMGQDEILAFLAALYRGFPDWSYDHDPPVPREDGMIGVMWRQGGTHTETLEFPGFEAYPATGTSFSIPFLYFFFLFFSSLLSSFPPFPFPSLSPPLIFPPLRFSSPPLSPSLLFLFLFVFSIFVSFCFSIFCFVFFNLPLIQLPLQSL